MRLSFPRKARLRRSTEFGEVFSSGKRLRVFPLRLRALERPGAERSRLGLAVGRKVGGAVVRNRWKRAIREAFRVHGAALPTGWDLVVSVDWRAGPQEVGRAEEAFLAAAGMLSRGAGQKGPSEGGQA